MGTAFLNYEKNCIKPRLEASLKAAETLFQTEKDSFKKRFLTDMERVCEQQNRSEFRKKIACMSWELLRTSIRTGQHQYRIMLYGKDWFLSDGVEVGATDLTLMLGLYHELEQQLKEDAKRYMGQIPPLMVETQVSYLLPLFHEYGKELIRYAMTEATELEAFQKLEKEDEFQIRVGECLEPGYLIYMENGRKDRDRILKWLHENEPGAYCCQDFRGVELSGLDLRLHDFRSTDFRDAVMRKSKLSFSLLTEAIFRRSCLQEADLSGCMLHGADFTGADLRQANMKGTLLYDGYDCLEDWKLAGYPGGAFTGADLRGADFRSCIYCGADFTGANLTGADFTGASLFRCQFTKDQLVQTSFTKEQKIHMIGL